MDKVSASESGTASDDFLLMQDLFLMRQARAVDLDSREDRAKSRDRLQAFFVGLQPILKPEMTLEIGAHFASFSQAMSKAGVEAHAFEANPYTFQAYARRIRRRAPGVMYHHLAISDADGEATFQVKEAKGDKAVDKVSATNSLLVRADTRYSYETVTVPSRRLDSFLAEGGRHGRSFSAWIDVEGALQQVTAGFGNVLDCCLSLIVEVEETAIWQGQMLFFDAMRYFNRFNLIPVARDFESPHQYNMVYLRRDLVVRPEVRMALARFLKTC